MMNGLRAASCRLESYAGKQSAGTVNGFEHSTDVAYVELLLSLCHQ